MRGSFWSMKNVTSIIGIATNEAHVTVRFTIALTRITQ